MLKHICSYIIVLGVWLFCFTPSFVFAAEQTIAASGSYTMSESDTMGQAKEKAKELAIRNAAEQAGVYVRSYTKTANTSVSEDQVEMIASQILKIKSCNFAQSISGESVIWTANVVVVIDDANIKKFLDNSKREAELKDKISSEQQKNKMLSGDATNYYIQKADQFIKDGYYEEAIDTINQYANQYGKERQMPAEAYYLRALSYLRLNDGSSKSLAKGDADINRAIAQNSKESKYFILKLAIQDEQCHLEESVAGTAQKIEGVIHETDNVISKFPQCWQAYFTKSIFYFDWILYDGGHFENQKFNEMKAYSQKAMQIANNQSAVPEGWYTDIRKIEQRVQENPNVTIGNILFGMKYQHFIVAPEFWQAQMFNEYAGEEKHELSYCEQMYSWFLDAIKKNMSKKQKG